MAKKNKADLRQRHNSTPQAKREFLKYYTEFGTVTKAAELTPVTRKTFYNWMRKDTKFAEQIRDIDEVQVEVLEEEAWRRGVEGVPTGKYYVDKEGVKQQVMKYSDALLTRLLQAKCPQKYKPEAGTTNVNVKNEAAEAKAPAVTIILPNNKRQEAIPDPGPKPEVVVDGKTAESEPEPETPSGSIH